MINFTENTKNQYKAYERELSVVGNLYLAEKRLSHNLFDTTKEVFLNSGASYEQTTGTIKATATLNRAWNYVAIKLNDDVLGKTLYFKCNFYSTSTYPAIYLFNLKNNEIREQLAFDRINQRTEGKLSFNYTFPSSYPSDVNGYVLLFYANTIISEIGNYTKYSNVMLSEENVDYEEYGTQVIDYGTTGATNNLFNINNCYYYSSHLENPDVDFKIVDDEFYFYNGTNNYVFVHTRLINLNDYKGQYITINFNFNNGYLELKRGTSSLASNDYIIEWGIHGAYTYLVPNNLEGYDYLWITPVINPNSADYITNIMINEGQEALPYERYNSSPFRLTEENECKILGFNINEKTDIYYTSLPYNTMTIEVDNEKGYFTFEDDDNILDKLNGNCYVDLFIKINDDNYYKIMTMNFVRISYSDYEKAKLEFYSCISQITNNEMLYDINKELFDGMSGRLFKKYLLDNYNIKLISDHTAFENYSIFNLNIKIKDLQTMILSSASIRFGLNKEGVLIITNYNNNLLYKIMSNISQENIIQNLQYEKPLIKRDNIYKNIKYTYKDIWNVSFEQTDLNYNKTIYYKLKSKKDVIVYIDNDYKLNEITINDISFTGNVNVQLDINDDSQFMLIFTITGDIGNETNITINKSNIKKIKEFPLATYGFRTNYNNEDKTLVINENSSVSSGIYDFIYIKKPILNYVEVRMVGLPYLEIGDTITIEFDNQQKRIIITDIDMNFNGGLTETIKGYELEWTHQAEYPYDDLNDWT